MPHGSVRSANPVPAGRKRFAAPAIVPAAVGQREYQQINPAIYPVVRLAECLSGITRLKWRKISPALPKRIWCKALRAALPRPESGVRRVLVSPAARQPGHKRFPACGLGGFLIRAFRFHAGLVLRAIRNDRLDCLVPGAEITIFQKMHELQQVRGQAGFFRRGGQQAF